MTVQNKRWHYLVFPLFTALLCFSCLVCVQAKTQEEELDLNALSREIQDLEEDYPYPDFEKIFDDIKSFRFLDALEEVGEWFLDTVTYEITSSKILMGELVGVVIFAAVFSNISSSFQQVTIGDSGFLISYFLTFTIIFSNFTIMANLFQNTVVTLSRLLKILLPVYTLTVTATGNLTTGMIFYEYFMILVLVINSLCLNVILPLIEYYLLLELLNHFSVKQNISKLCESLYFMLSRGMKCIFFLFFGFHLLETMVVPSFDTTKNAVLSKMMGMIPGAGSVAQTVIGTVTGSSILIKNTLGVTAIIFILLMLCIPMIKLLLYTLFYLLLAVLLEPVSDERFVKCILAAQKGGILLMYALTLTGSLFILTIAVTSFATNRI